MLPLARPPGVGFERRGVHCGMVRWRGTVANLVDGCSMLSAMLLLVLPRLAPCTMRHAMHSLYKGAAEMVMPVRSTSAFKEKGVRVPSSPPVIFARRPTPVHALARTAAKQKLIPSHLFSAYNSLRSSALVAPIRSTCSQP
jgi:hypothetical protein